MILEQFIDWQRLPLIYEKELQLVFILVS